MNSLSKSLNCRVSRISLALFAIVDFFTPNHPLSWSAFACGVCAGSNTKFTWPTA